MFAKEELHDGHERGGGPGWNPERPKGYRWQAVAVREGDCPGSPVRNQRNAEELVPLLRAGASAADVAQHLPYSERELRLMLRDLRAVGLIVPQRQLAVRQQFAARLQATAAEQTVPVPVGAHASSGLRATLKRLSESFH